MKSLRHKNDSPPFLPSALLLVLACGLSIAASAQERAMIAASFDDNQQAIKIDVQVGQSRVIDFDQEYERLSISDPKIADTVPISFKQVLVNGLAFGQINLVAWSKPKPGMPSRMLVFDIFVQVNLSLIDNQIKILFPKENIQLSQANNSVVLSGSVTRPEMSEQAQKIIEAAGLKVTNLLKSPVLDAAQVQLQIRVAEVNRQIFRDISSAYGFNNTTIPTFVSSGGPGQGQSSSVLRDPQSPRGTSNSTNLANFLIGIPTNSLGPQAFIRALYSRGALRDLAEPNLIAIHGHKASFLAGGEFPIPVIQSVNQGGQTAITIIFKEFGVKLEFTPTIIDENHIRLELAPEVSSLDFASGVQIDSLIIPGLRVRRAKTMLELRDGQSFALAGLIDNSERVNLSKVPLLADIPILGELFKSRSFQRSETELLFLATVKLVEPLNPDQLPRLPGVSELKPVNSTNPAGAVPSSSIEGQSGHSVPRKSDGGPEAENKTPADPSNSNKIDRGPTAGNLTSELVQPTGPTGPVGPVGVDVPAPKAGSKPDSKSEAGKQEPKEQKSPQQGNEKP